MKVNEIVTEAQQLNEIRSFIKVGEFLWKYIPLNVKKKMPWGKKPDAWNPDEFMQYLEKTGNAKRDLENLIKNVPSVEQLAKMEKHLGDYLKTNPKVRLICVYEHTDYSMVCTARRRTNL